MAKGIEGDRIQKQALQVFTHCSLALVVSILFLSESAVATVGRGRMNTAQQPATTEQNTINPDKQRAYERALQLLDEVQQLLEQGTAESRRLAVEKGEQALKILQELGEKEGEASALNLIGLTYFSSDEHQKAVTYFEQALTIWREKKNKQGEAITLITAALAYSEFGEQQTALNYLQQALSIYKVEKQLPEQAQALSSMGTVYMKFGQPNQALESLYQALEIYRAQNDLSNQASTLSFIAVIYKSIGEAEKAIDADKQAQEILSRANNAQQPATTQQSSPLQQAQERASQLLDEAAQLLEEGTAESLRQALEKGEQALKIWQELGEKQGEANALNLIGVVYSSIGGNQKAVTYFEQSLTIRRQKKDRLGEAVTLSLAASSYSSLGNQQTALNYYQQALSIFRAENLPTQQASILGQISGVYIKFGQPNQALESLYQALEIYRTKKDLSAQASVLGMIGATYASMGETKKALDAHKQELEIQRQSNDLVGQAEALRNVSFLYFSQGEFQKALENLNEALKLRQTAQVKLSGQYAFANLVDQSLILLLIAQAQGYLGNYQQAIDYNNQALSLVRKVGNPFFVANVLSASSTVYNVTNDYQKQLAILNEVLQLQRESSDRAGQAGTLNEIGGLYVAFGDYQQALNFYNQALELARQVENRSLEADTYRKIAEVYSFLGDYTLSENTITQALEIYQKLGNKSSQVQALLDIGEQERKAQEYAKALEFFQQGLQLSKEQQNSLMQLTLLTKMVMTYESMQDYPKGLDAAKEALSISRQIEIGAGEAVVLNLMGKVYQGLGEYDKALSSMRESASLANKLKNKQVEANTLRNMGKVYNRLQNFQEAINTFNQEIELRQAIGDRTNEAEALYNIAVNQRTLGNLDAARSQIEKTIAIIEGIRSNVDRQELRTSYFATVQKYYEFYIDLLMQLHKKDRSKGYDALALHASERARARSIAELLNQAGVDIRRGVDSKLVERERSIQQELNAIEFSRVQLLKGQYTDKQLEKIKQRIEYLLAELDQVQAEIRKQSPEYASLTQSNQSQNLTLTLPEIQKQVLDDDTLLLQYSLGEERSYLWVVSKTGITSYELPKRAEIEAEATKFYQQIRAEAGDSAEAGMKLSQMILAPVSSQLGQKRLLIVGDGVLQTIPFVALPVPSWGAEAANETNSSPASPTPLLVNHEVVSLPSASSIAVLRNKLAGRKVAPRTVAVLADPVFSHDDDRLKTPQPQQSNTTTNPYEVKRSAFDVGISIDRLPFSSEEAKDILAFVPENERLQALGFAASRATATNPALSQYRIVHLATHGLLNTVNPELSGVVLSLVNEKGGDVDGFLRLHDIYNLNLPAELVTLSACETGLGKDVKGEGLIGLTRGFMYAGAKRVVVSLWAVNDRRTADLMEKFYQQMLQKGLNPVAALRAAQLEMYKQGEAPYYWAAFVVQGEWQ